MSEREGQTKQKKKRRDERVTLKHPRFQTLTGRLYGIVFPRAKSSCFLTPFSGLTRRHRSRMSAGRWIVMHLHRGLKSKKDITLNGGIEEIYRWCMKCKACRGSRYVIMIRYKTKKDSMFSRLENKQNIFYSFCCQRERDRNEKKNFQHQKTMINDVTCSQVNENTFWIVSVGLSKKIANCRGRYL